MSPSSQPVVRRPVSRRLLAAVVAPLVVATGLVGPAPVAVRPAVAAVTASEIEAPDFASETWSDPWDYEQARDQNTDLVRARAARVEAGHLRLQVTGGDWFTPLGTTAGSLPYGRDGAATPVDPSRYRRLSLQMEQPTSGGVGAVVWFTCRERTTACSGGVHFATRPGDVLYDVDLGQRSEIGGGRPWSAAHVVELRVVPVTSQAQTTPVAVDVDWMRLYAPGTPHGAWPPGTWPGFVVSALPRPVVDSPAPSEGRDLATALGRRPWDFTTAAGASGTRLLNATSRGHDARGLTAVNAPPVIDDPQVVLPVSPFSGDRFHHLSFDMTYDGPFSLSGSAGGGKMARLIWQARGGTNFQISDDVLTFSGANAGPVQIDLTAGDVLDPQSGQPRLGWAGRTVEFLRFDPNEDPSAATWHLRSLHLREDPAAEGRTTVRFHDDAWQPGTTAEVRVGTGAPGSPYETIARDVPVVQGVNSVPFELGSRSPGSYRVEVVLRHPDGGGALAFSRTPVTMTRAVSAAPVGSLDSVVRVPGGVRVRGWAADPDAGGALRVHLRDLTAGRLVREVRTDVERPDVVRARPGTPLASGFDVVVPLPAGTRTLCAYGIDVGGSSNTTLGCRDVRVDTAPAGSLDGVQRVPGGLRLRGWAVDPDTASPVPVHAYVGARGTAGVADRTRTDVGRRWPGYGDQHGYEVDVPRGAGSYQACAYALDDASGPSTTLGCRDVTLSGSPVGSFDGATRSGDQVTVRGWTLDPDTAASTEVHVYVDRRGTAAPADAPRPDVARAWPGWGPDHGWSVTVPARPGSTICAYGIDSGGGQATTLGCRTV